ncbi:integrase core domain-containing protein [Nonomuraea sp. NPDC003201]
MLSTCSEAPNGPQAPHRQVIFRPVWRSPHDNHPPAMERWVQPCRRELLDRCLLWNEHHLRHALRESEEFYNRHRPHQALDQAAPLRAAPEPITDPAKIIDPKVRRRDRLGGVLHEYLHAA